MNPKYDFEDIEDYLQGVMSDADQLAFEQELAIDPALLARVEAVRAGGVVFKMWREETMLAQLEAWQAAAKAAEGTASTNTEGGAQPVTGSWLRGVIEGRRWVVLAAAAVLVGLLIGILNGYWRGESTGGSTPREAIGVEKITPDELPSQPESTPAPADDNNARPQARAEGQRRAAPPQTSAYTALASAYSLDPLGPDMVRSGEGQAVPKNKLQQAQDLYHQQAYLEALPLLLQPDSSVLRDYQFLRAHVYYALGRYGLALTDFQAFRSYRIAAQKLDAQWGEVACLLHLLPAQRAELEVILLQITRTPGHPKQEVAQKILTELARLPISDDEK